MEIEDDVPERIKPEDVIDALVTDLDKFEFHQIYAVAFNKEGKGFVYTSGEVGGLALAGTMLHDVALKAALGDVTH